MKNNTAGVIGLAARARQLSVGTNGTLDAIRARKALLVLIASDVSDNTRKTLTDKAAFYSVRTETLDITCSELGRATGHAAAAAVAFTDANFVRAYETSLPKSGTANEERGN